MTTQIESALMVAIGLALLSAGSAGAQDQIPDMMKSGESPQDTAESNLVDEAVSPFTNADGDYDGALSLSEFVTYVVNLADADDESARALVLSGDYETAFAELDMDEDGLLDESEAVLPKASDETGEPDEPDAQF